MSGGDEKSAERLPRSIVGTSTSSNAGGVNAVAQGDNAANHRANLAYTSTLPSDFNQTLRLSLTKSLTQYYAPLDEIPPQIQDLLARLDEKGA